MPETKTYPNNIEDWLSHLLKRTLPTALNKGSKALKGMQTGSPSYQDLANTVATDPIISLAIMRKANQNPRQGAVFSKTLDHAMSMLGHEQLATIFKKTPKLEEKYGYRAYYHAQHASLTRAYLAQQFAEAKRSPKSNDVFWGSLFGDAAEWYLWCYVTPLMRELERTPKAKQDEVAEELFGCPFNLLETEILRALGAPELALQTKSEQHRLSNRDWLTLAKFGEQQVNPSAPVSQQSEVVELSPALKIAKQSPLFFIELAHLYLHYYLEDSSPEHMSRVVAVCSAGLDLPPQSVRKLVTQSLLTSARSYAFPFTTSSVCRVFEDIRESVPEEMSSPVEEGPSQNYSREIEAEKPKEPTETLRIIEKSKTTAQHKTYSNFRPGEEFLSLLKRMKEAPSSFDSAANLMTSVVNAIMSGLMLERCSLFVVSKDQKKLKTYYSCGIEANDPLLKFETQIVNGTIFKVLVDKRSALWLKPTSRKEVADLVPMNFKQTSQRDEALFSSVFVRGKPIALIYADNAPDKAIDEAQFRYFKMAIRGLESALEFQSNQRAKYSKGD